MYELLKALHLISIICWMAGLLYLPRIFVYHCGAQTNSESYSTFIVMERRLFKYIMQPSMICSYATGLAISWILDWANFAKAYFHAKALCLLFMTIMHFWMMFMLKDFAARNNKRSHVFYRIVNEVPTILMIIIVLLVKLHK